MTKAISFYCFVYYANLLVVSEDAVITVNGETYNHAV